MAKRKTQGVIQQFRAVLQQGHNGLGWTIAVLPFEPKKVWTEMVRLRVRGTMEGFAFRTSLFPVREGGEFYVLVCRAMQKGGGVSLGDVAEFTLEPDFEERPAELPDELAVLLDDEPGLREFYDSFSESMRREMGKWVLLAKGDEARMRRSEQMAERLLGAMEGEISLPPVIERAFKLRPKARAGWAKMTPLQRRQGLLAVFYYQSPEAKEKRVQTLCDEAEKKA